MVTWELKTEGGEPKFKVGDVLKRKGFERCCVVVGVFGHSGERVSLVFQDGYSVMANTDGEWMLDMDFHKVGETDSINLGENK